MAVNPEEARPAVEELGRSWNRWAKTSKAVWGVYQQIAAVFTAFGVAALLGHLWHIGWRGAVAAIVGVWDATVRPAMEWVLHVLVTVPLSWLGVSFGIPLWVRDYLAVGIVATSSLMRDHRARGDAAIGSPFVNRWYLAVLTVGVWPAALLAVLFYFPVLRMYRSMRRSGINLGLPFRIAAPLVTLVGITIFVPFAIRSFRSAPEILPAAVVYLPLFLLYAYTGLALLRFGYLQTREPELKETAKSIGLALSPLLYLAVLLALNFWVMPYIS